MKSKDLIKKAGRVLKEEGIEMLARKTSLYLKNVASGKKIYSGSELAQNCYMDVLFINGCYLAHPSRYRVAHQREQLAAGGITSAEIFYTDITLDLVKNFRMFILFRCPYTDEICEFVKHAKSYNKTILFDIDDLMIDTQYTDTIPYVQTMPKSERKVYDDGVIATGKLLRMCDGAITTTEALAEELKKYVPAVYINRNVASEEMIKISELARNQCNRNEDCIRIGYFSGSITHNPDFMIVFSALVKLMEQYQNIELLLVGEMDVPVELKEYHERVKKIPMAQWRKLPQLIASVDINIAPLVDTLFNRAKSENKWLEAALVEVPTLASNVGAFKTMIQDGKTGFLVQNTIEDWYGKLCYLVENESVRCKVAKKAYNYVRKHCTTVYTGIGFANWLYKKMSPNVVFMLPTIQISGGALVTLKHAGILQKIGYDVTIFNDGYEKEREIKRDGRQFPVINKRVMQINANIDKCVATLWSTCDFFYEYGKIQERFYLIQNYETDFYQSGEPLRLRANATYGMRFPVNYITISKWCENWLKTDYHITAAYAPNGLESEHFFAVDRDYTGKIRILVEGNSDDYYKNVDESFRITNQLNPEKFEIWYMSYQGKPKDWYRVDRFLHKIPYVQVADVYRQCHILIKSSILESFSYPPLEMMATGGCVVVAPNGGNVEYLENEKNCLFYEQGNEQDAIKQIERLICDNQLRMQLIENGIKTAEKRNWDKIKKDIIALYQK